MKAASVGFLYPDEPWRARMRRLAEEADLGPEREWLRFGPIEELQAEHFRLFGSSGVCLPELSRHLTDNPFEAAKVMAHLAGFYRAFGVDCSAGLPPDHVSVCLDYAAYLRIKAAHAGERGLVEARETTERALKDISRQYLRPALTRFRERLREATRNPFYAGLAELALKEVEACVAIGCA